ncbi:hypothetical protein ACN28C_31640 [Plantactinospora sp. WMMC1484]|uniref:hypothetical protein n=1 Tax=Plantactinospora sp. WMMC1484 TaxID=3404122 RepID=UPI003BF5EC13
MRDIVVVLAGLCSPPRDDKSETARFQLLWRAISEGESGALTSFQEIVNGGLGGEDGKWTPELLMGILINPVGAIEIHPSLAARHEPPITEDQWVDAMRRLIEEQGANTRCGSCCTR